MKRLTTLLLLSAALVWGQNPETATFPGTVATDKTLLVAANAAATILTVPVTSAVDITLHVATTSRFIMPTVVQIDSEYIAVCSKTSNRFTVCTVGVDGYNGRGFSGSSAAVHAAARPISGIIDRTFHNRMAAELIAVQAKLHAESTSVKDFGAIGDGIANDTAAFQAACGGNRRSVFVPLGTYIIGDVTCGYGTVVTGAGTYGTILSVPSGAAFGLKLTSNGDQPFTRLQGVNVYSSVPSSATGIIMNGTAVTVRDVIVGGFYGAGGKGIHAINSTLGVIENSLISGNTQNIVIDQSGGGDSYEFRIDNTFLRDSTAGSLVTSGPMTLVSSKIDIEQGAGTGPGIILNAGGVTLYSPHVEGWTDGIQVTGLGVIDIYGGSISGSSANCLHVITQTLNTRVHGTVFINCPTHVRTEAGTLNLLLENVIDAGTGAALVDAGLNTFEINYSILGNGTILNKAPFTWSGIAGDWAHVLDAQTGHQAGFKFAEAGVQRWLLGKDYLNNLSIGRYTSAGVFIDQPMIMLPSTGDVSLLHNLGLAGVTSPQAPLDLPTGDGINVGTGHGLILSVNKGGVWPKTDLLKTGFTTGPGDWVDITVPGTSAGSTKFRTSSVYGVEWGINTLGVSISSSTDLPQVGTPTAGQAACIKAAGPPVIIGYCSTVVDVVGACTCN